MATVRMPLCSKLVDFMKKNKQINDLTWWHLLQSILGFRKGVVFPSMLYLFYVGEQLQLIFKANIPILYVVIQNMSAIFFALQCKISA